MSKLFVRTLKKGPGIPIVFLHGFLGSSLDWERIVPFLPNCNCFGIDLPGHGNSPFMEELRIDLPRFHLVGYSMGGRIAMQFREKHPEKVASLTAISAHPGLTSEEEKQKRKIHDAKWAKMLLELPIDQFLKKWYAQPIFKPFKPDLSMRMKQNTQGLAKALMHFSLSKQPAFAIDTCIVGEFDTKFRTLYTNPIVIPNAGHCVHLEKPEELTQIIKERTQI